MKKEKVIDMVNHKGTFVPAGSHYEKTVYGEGNRTIQGRQKAMPPMFNLEKTLQGIVTDFFKVMRREMFR